MPMPMRLLTGSIVNVLESMSSALLNAHAPPVGSRAASTLPLARLPAEVFARLQDVAEDSAVKLEAAGLSAEPIVLNANARTELVEEAKRWNADMIFVGARGLGRLDRLLLGSVSTAVVMHAGCSVEVIRAG